MITVSPTPTITVVVEAHRETLMKVTGIPPMHQHNMCVIIYGHPMPCM
jgi:hypothetical protein